MHYWARAADELPLMVFRSEGILVEHDVTTEPGQSRHEQRKISVVQGSLWWSKLYALATKLEDAPRLGNVEGTRCL